MNSITIRCLLILLLGFTSVRSAAQQDIDLIIKDISKTLNNKLSKQKKKCVAIANFTDGDGNPTKLGRYIADELSVELSNTDLKVADRSKADSFVSELRKQKSQSVIPDPEHKYGDYIGIDYFIVGTITPFDTCAVILIKVLNYKNGTVFTGIPKYLPLRNPTIVSPKSNIEKPNNENSKSNTETQLGTHNRSSLDDPFHVNVSDLRPGECVKKIHSNKDVLTVFYGQVCFENQTGEDLMFYCVEANPGGWLTDTKIVIPNGASNCSPLIAVNWENGPFPNENESKQAAFYFYSIDQKRRAKQSFTIDKCKVRSFVLTNKNMILMRD